LFDSSPRPTKLLETPRRLYYRSNGGNNGLNTEVNITIEISVGGFLWTIAGAIAYQQFALRKPEKQPYM